MIKRKIIELENVGVLGGSGEIERVDAALCIDDNSDPTELEIAVNGKTWLLISCEDLIEALQELGLDIKWE